MTTMSQTQGPGSGPSHTTGLSLLNCEMGARRASLPETLGNRAAPGRT